MQIILLGKRLLLNVAAVFLFVKCLMGEVYHFGEMRR